MLESKASFSEDRRYRFSLYRRWAELGAEVLFICLNPSTADEHYDDPTVWRCVNFARDWGFRGMWLGNLFALVTTDPAKLSTPEIYEVFDPVGRGNDLALKAMAARCAIVVYAWGNHGRIANRGRQVADMIIMARCFGINKTGEPKHPLYLPRHAQLIRFRRQGSE